MRRINSTPSSSTDCPSVLTHRSVADFFPSGLGELTPAALTHSPEANDPRPTLKLLVLVCERSAGEDDGLRLRLADVERLCLELG